MTAMAARLLLSLAAVLLTAALYVPVFYIAVEGFGLSFDMMAIWVTNLVCGGFLMASWVLVWRSQVLWTPVRIFLTAVSWIVAGVPAALLALAIMIVESGMSEFALILAATVWAPCWMGIVAMIWRETKAERRQRQDMAAVVCPACGYRLTGLSQPSPSCAVEGPNGPSRDVRGNFHCEFGTTFGSLIQWGSPRR